MITKRFAVLYKKGSVQRYIDEITVSGETDEECYDEACQLVTDAFTVEAINEENVDKNQ